ncbi:hypothetical protein [Foetidibacter luteolus]|uniref:hypothetical protein n=1 Tax=Foetidibacter luteolus TaxID=2608880 RepID=UPI00129A721E|nr:hypothetical protein [Foetidibacter luteolus]
MDTKLIHQFGTEILSYRLRTARQKKRMQYEDFDKQLIALEKEENLLYEQQKNLGWEPLNPPYQKGWNRFFVLSNDVAKSKHADFFKEILRKINTCEWNATKDFRKKKKRVTRRIYIIPKQELLKPDEQHFNKLNFNDNEKQFFHPEYRFEKSKNGFIKYYVFNEPWRYVLKIKPNFISQVRKHDALIEKRLREIRNYVHQSNLSGRIGHLLDGHYPYRRRTNKKKEPLAFKHTPLPRLLDAIKEQEM